MTTSIITTSIITTSIILPLGTRALQREQPKLVLVYYMIVNIQ